MKPTAAASDAQLRGRAEPDRLLDHFFRQESAKLVAVLTRAFGLRHLDLVEDVVQSALLQALETWKFKGPPRDAAAWVYRVARNKALDALRRQRTVEKYAGDVAWLETSRTDSDEPGEPVLDHEVRDSQLRMMFACSHGDLPPESRVALALKILCGFGIREIAHALLTSESNVKKRIYRAKQKLAHQVAFEVPAGSRLAPRLESVHSVLYLLFNEGYNSQRPDELIRRDLCAEAIRLCHQLNRHSVCRTPATSALLALMLFHAARFDARLDAGGGILLLADQDRDRWDRSLIAQALEHLEASASGGRLSRYHLEAGIAAHHCLAPSFDQTEWQEIRGLYDRLLALQPSPVTELNRAIVVAQLQGPMAGIAAIESTPGLRSLDGYHLLDATLGELYFRSGETNRAREHFEAASTKTRSHTERRLLIEKLHACGT